MKKLITELRDRGVVRGAGLYIAVTWLVLQISDVVFPAFGIPDSVLRYIVYAAVAGTPLLLVFTWFFEVTSEGIRTETEVRESGDKRSSKGYFSIFTIIALMLALAVSLTVNYQQASDTPVQEPELVSILVADFLNHTGDPVFDGSLEAATTIGIEGASFISAFARHTAQGIAEKIASGSSLSEESARLVSVREGIDLVLAGEIHAVDEGYELSQRIVNPLKGSVIAEATATAGNKAAVLPAVGELTTQIREALGDLSLRESDLASNETFTSTSLQAVSNYTKAQAFAHKEQNTAAIEYYKKAVAEDPEFGRAYSGWATSELKLGHTEKSEELWQKTLTQMDGMTERERYRTLGVYYLLVSANYSRAIENFRALVEKYPADGIGWNNLGMAYFYSLKFAQALEVGAELVKIYPGNPAFLANYALFAMYAGDFTVARNEAEQLLTEEPGYFLAYLPLAMSNLAEGKTGAAREVYQRMSAHGERARSLAVSGQADIALLVGDYALAASLLGDGRIADATSNNSQGAAHKGVYLAYAELARGDSAAALAATEQALQSTSDLSHLLPAASLLIRLGQVERAQEIAQDLGARLAPSSRAAADYLAGEIALQEKDAVVAVDALNRSLAHTDTWLARLALGRAYGAAGYHAEALGEFELCEDRMGESTSLFLDDVPTFHYHAPLYYWLGRTKMELGMRNEARSDLSRYLSLRIDSDTSVITQNARAMLASMVQ